MERIEEFIEALKEKGIRIWSDNEKLRYQAAKGAMDSQTLEKIKEKKVEILEFLNNKSDIEVVFKSNQAERYEPFPLTNIQNSYVIGRNSAYELGDVTCHGYIEITYQEELDKEKLEMAWNKVIAKHDMLRAIIYENGYQRVQKDVPEVKIESYDLRTCSEDEQLLNLQNIRANYAEKQYPLGQWPMCDIVLSLWKGKSIIHFSLDMLITDFMSANLILNDLDNYYHGKAVEVKVETLYRDIVLYNQRKSMSKSKERKKAERYWQDKIRNMGTAPELIINNQKTGERETFKQLKFFIDEEGKENINEIAKELRVTASTVILTAFGEVINKWSKNSKFSINMTMLSRDKTIPGVDKVVGDFTDVNVYSMDYSSCKSFESRILENQVSLWEDLQNNAVSGIEVLRELGREKKENVMIPIVYTSTLGVSDSDNSFLSRSNISYKISQTPQVWIDCQIAEENGGVAVNWDYRTGVFLQNVIRDMFEAFERVLKRLGKKDNTVLKETDPIGLPEKTQAVRNKVNATERELPESLMAEGFVKSCVLYPNKTALITKDGEYTYAALKQYVSAVQHTLLENGLKPGDSAAVMLPKGIWQIAGVLGTLLAGGVYLPIDSKQPLQRRNDIIQDSGVKFVLTEKVEELYNQEKLTTINVNILDATTEYQLREIAGVRGSDPAYIIYTSGTTGKPKGVVISHEAAMNTIYDVIERFSLNRETVILGLSNLAFDLSVFDIFGCFQVGGTLVLPDDELKKNPKHILDLIIINRVTVLNAVPAQMKMLDSYMDNAGILEISWVTPYNSLIAYITERSQENEAVMGFTFGDEAEYLAIPTDKIFENLGKKYGRILSELGFTEYTLIGHCVGGLIALETAHYLKDKGKNVSSVTLLSTSIPHKKEETVLADLDMKIFETAVQTSLYNELLLERTFASLIDADIKKAGHQVDNDTLQQVIEYLIFNNGGNITVQALCSLTGKFAEVGAEFQRLHSMSATERMNDLYTTIERPNGQLMEHQRKMLNVLFRVFAQNFRCVSSYIPKVYTGKMRVFDCESAIANFFPSLFSEDKKTWEQYAQGEFLFDTMKGDHISCMNSPYIEENVKKILDL